ncbi:MAG: hypothetical protein ACI80S_001131, partial [Pseudohongiellaceae bacterium]
YSYSSQVNRRIASAHFLISSYAQLQNNLLAPSEKQAFIDSILLQLYCGCVSYCNELLSHHSKSTVNSSSFNLSAVFDQKKYAGISEFTELYWLFHQKKCGFFELCSLYENLTTLGSKEEQEKSRMRRKLQEDIEDASSKSSAQRINLVTIDAVNIDSIDLDSGVIDISDIAVVKELLRIIQELIDRQREYLLEY